MKVDKVPEELAKSYYIDDNDYQDLHKGMEIISDDEVEMPVKKVGEKLKNLFNCYRLRKYFLARLTVLDIFHTNLRR